MGDPRRNVWTVTAWVAGALVAVLGGLFVAALVSPEWAHRWLDEMRAGMRSPPPPTTVTEPGLPLPAAPAAPAASTATAPPAAPASAAAPADTPSAADAEAAAQALRMERVKAFVTQWAADWSAKELNGYFAAYHPAFRPEGGKTASAWASERKQRILSKKSIVVEVSDLKIVSATDEALTVSFVQRYQADRLASTSPKFLQISTRDGQWAILREYTP